MIFYRSIKLIGSILLILIFSYLFIVVRLCRYEKIEKFVSNNKLKVEEAKKHWKKVDTANATYYKKYHIQSRAYLDGLFFKRVRDTIKVSYNLKLKKQ